jgi:hypothetical protein
MEYELNNPDAFHAMADNLDDDVGVEGNTNLEKYKNKGATEEEEKQMILNMNNKIKNTVDKSKAANKVGRPESEVPELVKAGSGKIGQAGRTNSVLLKKLSHFQKY